MVIISRVSLCLCQWRVIWGQTAATRAIGYETDDNTGFPTPVGIFDKGTSEGKEIADGSKVDVLLSLKVQMTHSL